MNPSYNVSSDFSQSKMPFFGLKSLKELYSPIDSNTNPVQYVPHNSEPSYSKFFESEKNPFSIYSKPFVPRNKPFSPIMYTIFNDLSEKDKSFIVYYHKSCALCHESVPINPNTIILRDIINLICYTLHQSCYNSILTSGKDVLNPSAIAKITIIKGELNLLAARTAIAPISVDIFPVVQLKSDISLAVFGTIAINSYQCFAGEKTILLEQKLENVNFKSAFTRIRITFRWLETNIEYSIDLLNTFSTYNSQMVTLVLQCMNMHVYIEGIINKSIIKDQNTFILSINKISIEITKAQLMSFTNSSMGSKYEEIIHSCGNLAISQPSIIKKINSDLNSIESPIKPHTPIRQSTPKHSKTPISEKSHHKIVKLDNELLNNLTENPVEFYKGKIFELAKTQQGSKYLQNVVQYSTQESICFIASEVENDFAALLIDKYGNYFCQKFIQSIQPAVRVKLLKIV